MVAGPIGASIQIGGLAQFRAAKNEVVRGFAQIQKAVKSIGSTALPSVTGGSRGGLYTGGSVGGIGVYQRLPVQLGLIGVAAGLAGAAVSKMGAEFGQTINTVQVFGDASEEEARKVSKAAITMSRSFTASANDIGKGAIALGKAGVTVEKQLTGSVLRAVTVFNQASQGEVDLVEASDLVTQTVKALGLEFSESTNIVDAYVGAVNSSTATFSDFTTQLKQTLPIAGALNIGYEELATTLAVLNQAGLRGSLAGTALKNALIAIADPTSEAAEILEKYNISLFDAKGDALPLIEVIGRLSNAFGDSAEGMTDAQRFFETTDIFNTRQILAALTLIKQGTVGYTDMLSAIRRVSSEQVAADLQNNVIDQLKLVGNQLQANTLIVTGEFEPAVVRALSLINDELRGMGEEGLKQFGQDIRDVITLSDQNFNLFLARLVGVVAGIQEFVAISKEEWAAFGKAFEDVLEKNRLAEEKQFARSGELSVQYKAQIQEMITAVEALPPATTVSMELTTAEFEKLTGTLSETSEKWTVILDNMAIHIQTAFLMLNAAQEGFIAALVASQQDNIRVIQADIKVLEDFFGTSEQVIAATATTSEASVNRVDQAVFTMIAIFNEGIAILNQFLGLLGIATAPISAGSAAGAAMPDMVILTDQAKENIRANGEFIDDVVEDVMRSAAGGAAAVGKTITDTVAAVATGVETVVDTAVGVVEAGTKAVGTAGQRIFDANQKGTQAALDKLQEWNRALVAPDRTRGVGIPRSPPFAPGRVGAGGSTFPPGKDDAGTKGAKEDVDKLAARIHEMLRDVPALTSELSDFIASIATDFPERLAPMVAALKASRGEIGQLVLLKRDMLAIDLQLIASADRLSGLEAEAGRLDIQQALAVIGYDKQMLGLRQQLLEIDHQMNPLRDQLLMIEREISKLQEENLVQTRARIGIELEMLPLRRQIEEIDRQIAATQKVNYQTAVARLHLEMQLLEPRRELAAIDREMELLGRKNFDLERARIQDEIAALPIRRQIRDIEEAIANAVDRRANITRQLKELDLADIDDSLGAAWEKMDVKAIIALEAQKELIEGQLQGNEKAERAAKRNALGLELVKVGLEEQLDPIEKRLQGINDTTTATQLLNELTLLGLEEQKQAIEDLLFSVQEKIDAIAFEDEKRRILNEITRLGLEEEKEKILALLEPLELKLAAINYEITAENLRNQLTITHLEEERRKIIEQLQPLEDQRRAIERITQEVDILRARAALEFEERKIGIQEMILNEKLRQAELEATKREQNKLFSDLVLGFVDSIAASGAFTLDEALEVAQRLRLWNDQIAKLAETVVEFNRLDRAAEDAAGAIRSIERNVTVTITTVHRDVYEGSGGAPAPTGAPEFARGGIVPGLPGQPVMALVHGGERIVNPSLGVPTQARAKEVGGMVNNGEIVTNNYNNYNVSPSYTQYQSPASVAMDMRALIMQAARQ